jgi:predicted RNase H-like HicB family nuclease
MDFIIDFEQETDGRWIAGIPELPGVLAYRTTKAQAGRIMFSLSMTAMK